MAARAESIVDLKDTRSGRRRPDRRLQAVRGDRKAAPAEPKKRYWRRWLVLALIVGLLTAAGSWGLKQYAASFAVQHVEIQGEFHNEQAHQIKQALLPYVKGDFFTVNLSAARESVTGLPWVRSASLRRRWPNRVQVRIEEQVPVARWNDGAFINSAGEVFTQAYGADLDRLPSVGGPGGHSVEVKRMYSTLNALVSEYGMAVARLEVDRRDTWTLQLQQGPVLRLGGEALEQRLRRFLAVTAAGKGPELAAIEAVDLRYSNGFAVDWKPGQAPGQTDAKEVQRDV